jgi:hypothetical protein
MDKLGTQALKKSLKYAGVGVPSKKKLYYSTLAGDIAGNAGYYSLVGLNPKHSILTGGVLGLIAGIGALALPEKLGLDKKYSNATRETQLLTVGLYVAAGLIAGGMYRIFNRRKNDVAQDLNKNQIRRPIK